MIVKNSNDFDFRELNLEHLKQRFYLKEIKLFANNDSTLDQTLVITSKHYDEWKIIRRPIIVNSKGRTKTKAKVMVYHKNKRDNTREYHKEDKVFRNIFALLSYIKRHDYSYINNRKVKGKSRLMKLFDAIA